MPAPDIASQMSDRVGVVATSSTNTNSTGLVSTKPKPCGVDRGPRGGIYDPFPLKFHRVLDEIAHEGLDSVVSWVSHGRAFKIHNPSLFVSDVMPRFFSQSKYTSFQRQLNLYGFSRCCRGPDAGAYYHPYFLRGKRMLTRHILRTKIKGCGNKSTTMKRQDSEPDFYAMAPLDDANENNGGYSTYNPLPIEHTPVSASSILIYELAMVCTTLCNLRKDTNV